MAQYAMSPEAGRARRTIDYVDVDADKWRQYAQGGGVPMAWLYAREARCLLAHDVRAAQAFDVSLFVSESETALFRRLTGIHHSVVAVANGIDHAFFAPEPTRPTPFRDGAPALVFTGAMDYRANVDAVRWFISEVWPKVRLRAPTARFYVVGARPGRAVRALAGEDIVVTGRVPDVRPYLQHATAVVAPMRIARGIQNKVLEGMSMGRVVLTTSMGLEGIDAVPGQHLLIADEPTAMADLAEQVLRGRHGGIGAAARELIREHYDWRDALERFLSAVAGDTASEQVCA
jgi:sugar transferase (PEP-CTERM/EpsH1 system associated)